MPYKSFEESAKVLDYKRLGKQRLEVLQIFNALHNPKTRWRNHPAVLMWKGYEKALLEYGCAMCSEWISRGYEDILLNRFTESMSKIEGEIIYPNWLGKEEFHISHRSNLIRKNSEFYQNKWPDIQNNLPYYWPTKHLGEN